MSILVKGTDFGPTEQVTSTKLDNLVDAASFTNTSEAAVSYSGSTGTCLEGGGLEVTSAGQLQIKDSDVDLVKFSTALKDSIHPVGIILETTQESTAAAFQTKIGFGTWEAYGSGRVTVGIDAAQTEFDTIGETSGFKEVTLTAAESGLPAHSHLTVVDESDVNNILSGSEHIVKDGNSSGGGSTNDYYTLAGSTNTPTLGPTKDSTAAAASSAHTNLQPYIVVYRYRRTA